MSYYLVNFEGHIYANEELYYTAIAKGERTFMKMLSNRAVVGKKLLDQMLFPVDLEQQKICAKYNPTLQDFDDFFKHLNIVARDTLQQIKKGNSSVIPNATIIPTSADSFPEQYKYRQVSFFRLRDYKEAGKYRMLSRMASIRICGFIYVALNAVDIRIESPYIITLK